MNRVVILIAVVLCLSEASCAEPCIALSLNKGTVLKDVSTLFSKSKDLAGEINIFIFYFKFINFYA